MNPITEHELVLYHYRDGLDPARAAEIERALFYDAELRLRLAALRELLAASAEALEPVEADAGLEARVWARLAPALPRRVPAGRHWHWRDLFSLPRIAFASMLVAALGIGYLAGRGPSQEAPALLADDAAGRVLDAYLVHHLHATERLLLVAGDQDQDDAIAAELASALLASHRLYAQAAMRAERPALAALLRELEPVVVELSRSSGPISPELRADIAQRDLAFKTRAAAALSRPDVLRNSHTL